MKGSNSKEAEMRLNDVLYTDGELRAPDINISSSCALRLVCLDLLTQPHAAAPTATLCSHDDSLASNQNLFKRQIGTSRPPSPHPTL